MHITSDMLVNAASNFKGLELPKYHEFKTQINSCDAEVYEGYMKAGRDVTDLPTRIDVVETEELIGGTPLINLRKLAAASGLKCNLLGKAEFCSVGNSVKDRIGLAMIKDAEAKGLIKKGDFIIEATSGNTGVGLAMVCAMRGYKMIVMMPEKMSQEKECILTCLGAQVIRTPSAASFDAPDSHLSMAYKLVAQINRSADEAVLLAAKTAGINSGNESGSGPSARPPRAICLDQYLSEGNVNAHYHGTALEIIEGVRRATLSGSSGSLPGSSGSLPGSSGCVDVFVATAGTGGTLSGCGRRLKAHDPSTKIVCVDPTGSILHCSLEDVKKGAVAAASKPYEIEGIGYDFHPSTFFGDEIVDEYVLCNDRESFATARLCHSLEGLLVGGSAGAALAAAIRVGRNLEAGKNVVVILPDGVRNYMSKFANDSWMTNHGIYRHVQEHPAYETLRRVQQRQVKVAAHSTAVSSFVFLFEGGLLIRELSADLTVTEAFKLQTSCASDVFAITTCKRKSPSDLHPESKAESDSKAESVLLGFMVKEDFAELVILGRGDRRLNEVASPHSIAVRPPVHKSDFDLAALQLQLRCLTEERKSARPVVLLLAFSAHQRYLKSREHLEDPEGNKDQLNIREWVQQNWASLHADDGIANSCRDEKSQIALVDSGLVATALTRP